MRFPFTRIGIAVCAATIALGVPALAGSTTYDEGSAIIQYGEDYPGADGPVRPGTVRSQTTPLPANSANSLDRVDGSAQDLLKKIATESGYGNQGVGLGAVATPNSGTAQSSFGRSLGASFQPGSGSKNRLIVLLTVIIASTAALGFAAVRKQRTLNRR